MNTLNDPAAMDQSASERVAEMLYTFEQPDGLPWEWLPDDDRAVFLGRADKVNREYATSLPLITADLVTLEVAVGLVDTATGGPVPSCVVCEHASRAYVADREGNQTYGCLGHLGILAAVALVAGGREGQKKAGLPS